MKTTTANFLMLMICLCFVACQGTDKDGTRLSDSAPAGNPDSVQREDTLKNPRNITHQSKVEEDGDAFLDSAAIGGMMEVELGKLALQKSANAEVKKFAAQMVADHSKANMELKAIAQKLKVLVPEGNLPDVKAHVDALKKYSGKEFDVYYMDMMVKDHVKTLELFRSASSLSSKITDFAAKTLPILEKHYEMAKAVRAGLK